MTKLYKNEVTAALTWDTEYGGILFEDRVPEFMSMLDETGMVGDYLAAYREWTEPMELKDDRLEFELTERIHEHVLSLVVDE